MICDDLKHLKRYQGLNKNLDTAIDYLQTHDLAALPDGRTEVDGDNVFINMMDATLHSDHGFHPEYHKTYADLQIDITGGEGNFVVFNGPDEQFVSGRVIGADGGIGGTYAVMPELYLAMNDHINKGEIKEAQAIQYDADRIIYKMCEAHGNLYAVQKEILRRMYGLELGGVREPMPGLIPEDEPIVAEAQAMIEAAIAKL